MAMKKPRKVKPTKHSVVTEWGTTERDERFCHEFLRDYNASAAIRRAGYNGSQPGPTGSNTLRKQAVRDRIDVLQKEIFASCKSSMALVVNELMRIAFFDPRTIASWDAKGMKLVDSKKLSVEDARMVESVEFRYDGQGNPVTKFKRASSMDALKTLAMLHKDAEDGSDIRERARSLRFAFEAMSSEGGPSER